MDPLPDIMADLDSQVADALQRERLTAAALTGLLANHCNTAVQWEQLAHHAVLMADLTIRTLREIHPRG
jgi:hypothetical protein